MNHTKRCATDMTAPISPNEFGKPTEVADALHTTAARLAQMRHLGTGPRYVKVGRRVLYRWTDIYDWLDANTHNPQPR